MTREVRPRPARAPRPVRWLLALLAAAQVALIGWSSSTRAGLLSALAEGLLIALCALVLLADRYVRFRRRYEADLVRAAAQRERTRLAEDLHDVLGHELSLIALRAAALQVSTTGRVSTQAGELRLQIEQTVLQLRQTVQLLHDGPADPSTLEPAVQSLTELVARAQASGAHVTLHDRTPSGLSGPVRVTVCRVVQEGLTNAAKHAPGAAVEIHLRADEDGLDLLVVNDDPGRERAAPPGMGFAGLRRRVTALDGELRAGVADGRYVLRARIPLDGAQQHHAPDDDRLGSAGSRRPGPATLRWALLPALTATVAVVAFYAWAGHDATLEQPAFDRIAVGQPAAAVERTLPVRQAQVRLISTAPRPSSARCAYYTDGNFPLAMATFEICFDADHVSRVTDLRTVPLT